MSIAIPGPDEEATRAAGWDPALLARMLRYALPYWKRVLLGILLVFVTAFLWTLLPLLVGTLVDIVFRSGDSPPARILARVLASLLPGLTPESFLALPAITKLWIFSGIFLVVRLSSFLLEWGFTYLLQGLGQRVIYDVRNEVFGHIHSLSLSWFHKNPVGRLVTRTTNDVGALEEMFTNALVPVFKDLLLLVGIAAALLLMDLRLGLITLSVLPPMTVATVLFRRVARAAYRRWRDALSRLNAFLAEALSGIRVVKLYGREEANDEAYDRIGREYMRHFLGQRRAFAIFRPINRTLSAAGIGLVLWFGGGEALAGAVSVGMLVSFINYAEQFFVPIRDMTEKFDVLQSAMTAGERIFAILDQRSEIRDRPGASEAGCLRGRVEFREVRFAYVPGEPVLRGVSFVAEPGATLAVVGHTGAGKTTLVNLLCRFHDVGEGSIRVDGTDIRDLLVRSLRRNIAVVHQDVFLFAGTVLDNVRLGDEAISLEQVRKACRTVAAHRFIERLDRGYDTVMEEGGRTLSAGERQLLSFARALVTDPAILVLDEATASIDTPTEELIQAAIERLTRDRTSIVIAHRLSTVRRADRILVMDGGRIVESGTHEELLARPGAYRRLYRRQFADQEARFRDPPPPGGVT